MGVAGSVNKITLDGVTFRIAGDADINTKYGGFETEIIATSGEDVPKMIRRPQIADGVDITVDAAELALLIALNDRTDNFTLAYNDASNNLYTSVGKISIDDSSLQDSKATIKILPVQKWEIFAA